MSSEFTYPSFRCILEYLEANKRIHICARSNALQKIDKKIPLHIEYLRFSEYYICVNYTRIGLFAFFDLDNEEVLVDSVFRLWNQVVMPEDVCIKGDEFYELSKTENLEVRNQKHFEVEFFTGSNTERRIPPDIPQKIGLKKAATVLFGGRCSIHVSELSVSGSILRLPVGFNIRIKNSLDIDRANRSEVLQIIAPRSLPLKTIKLSPRTPEMYYHPYVQTAETLITSMDRSRFLQEHFLREILAFPHKNIIVFLYNHDNEAMSDVVQDWLDHPREHGRTFTLSESRKLLLKRLYQIKKQFNGRVVLISGNRGKRVNPKAVIIPINSTSELLIYIVELEGIKLESIPTGTNQSKVYANLTYRDILWSHWSSVQERFEEDERLAPLIFISAGLVFCFAVLFYILYEFYHRSYPRN